MENQELIKLIAVVAAFLQIAKTIPQIAKYTAWLPLASVALGIGMAYLAQINEPIMSGTLVGLSASGAYDFLKAKNSKKKPETS